MTAETAVAIAGGFTERAARRDVVVTRRYYEQGLVRGAVRLHDQIYPGDTIVVRERFF